ncbi:hypothetical protein HAX54_000639 [Datura stramonium]|uniref:phosphogluconate dehydrogenase (NADP(+)-dependent, decarboxylating) n=1 Tax=Datura stramonium TaxID=4076 RepID=A0ABS8RRY6_DATST|nr:hypothetical protein [Datura stramonium]
MEVNEKGFLYLGMGVSGDEEGARNGSSLMPGGAFLNIMIILIKVAALVEDGPCVTYIGEGDAGNFVKMVYNGIEYGDSEAYDVLKNAGECGEGLDLNLGELARIWKGGCIRGVGKEKGWNLNLGEWARAVFLDRIKRGCISGVRGCQTWWLIQSLLGRWCRDKQHGGGWWDLPSRGELVFQECRQRCSILTGVLGFLRTLCRLKGTTLGNIPTRGLICQDAGACSALCITEPW